MTAYGMTPSETVEALVRRGVPRDKAERSVYKQEPTIAQPKRETVALPLTITLPWSCLISDNERYSATIRSGKPLLVLAHGYSDAKARIKAIARNAVAGKAPDLGPVELHGQVAVPDHRRHDVSNFCKIVHDALGGIVFRDDNQITKLTWEKVGVDVDSPKAVVTISRAR